MGDEATDSIAVGRYGPFAVAIVTMALVVWPIAFNLGAFGVVFYLDIFQFVVLATAGLGISLLSSPYSGRRKWLTNAALAAPAAWFAIALMLTDSTAEAATDPVLGPLALVVALVAVPVVLKMVGDMFVPGFMRFERGRLLYGGVALIVLIGAVSYVAGLNNDRFLTCADFKIAGSDQALNCQK